MAIRRQKTPPVSRPLLITAPCALVALKQTGAVRAIGIEAFDWRAVEKIATSAPIDFLTLVSGLSVLYHPPELLDFIDRLHQRNIAVVIAAPFHNGFLVGGNYLDGRQLNRDLETDRKLFAWRKSFAALCHGHGVTPAHANLQFILSTPGVTAVRLTTTYPDRIAENVQSIATPVPRALWMSLQEDSGLNRLPHAT